MSKYRITCYRHGDKYSSRSFEALDDHEATFYAIGEILNIAVEDDEWANGEIELTDPYGRVIHAMAEKD